MTGLWFTYGPDAACLEQSVGAFRDAAPDPRVCLLDDGREPLPGEVVSRIAPDHHEPTTWPRRGNLRGWTHALCALDAYARMAALTGAGGILKVDCDTLLLDASWVDTTAPVCGHDNPLWPCLHGGMGYWMRRDAAESILAGLAGSRFEEGEVPVNEDHCISWWAMRFHGGHVKVLPADWRLARTFLHHRPGEDYSGAAVLTFGDRSRLAGTDGQKRAAVAAAMRRFRETVRPAGRPL